MQRRNRDLVRSGRAISSNLLQPPTPRPRAPGQHRRRFSGSYTYWGQLSRRNANTLAISISLL